MAALVKQIKCDVLPLPRSDFGMCCSESNVYIFGGLKDIDGETFDDFWRFDCM